MSNERQQHRANESGVDPLDGWLAQARWPEPAPDVHARLEAIVTSRDRLRTHDIWLNIKRLALAACITIVIGSIAFAWAITRISGLSRTPVVHTRMNVAREVVHTRASSIAVRPPTKLELAILAVSHSGGSASSKPIPIAQRDGAVARPLTRSVDDVIATLARTNPASATGQALMLELLAVGSQRSVRAYLKYVVDSATREAALSVLDRAPRNPCVDVMVQCFNDPLVDLRLAAARSLGRINGPELTERLVKMAERNQNRREAMIALACSRGAEAQWFVRRAAESGPLVSAARSILVQDEFHPSVN